MAGCTSSHPSGTASITPLYGQSSTQQASDTAPAGGAYKYSKANREYKSAVDSCLSARGYRVTR